MSNNLSNAAFLAIVGGLFCLFGAMFARSYAERISIPMLGVITRYPYERYVFPLFFFAGLLLIVGLVAGISSIVDKARPRKIVLKPVSHIPAELFEPCSRCGLMLPPGSRFCNWCGQAITQNQNEQSSGKPTP